MQPQSTSSVKMRLFDSSNGDAIAGYRKLRPEEQQYHMVTGWHPNQNSRPKAIIKPVPTTLDVLAAVDFETVAREEPNSYCATPSLYQSEHEFFNISGFVSLHGGVKPN
ncbi:hypothetical protein AB0758_46100 [Tolypothrix bouteillei VB521301_2]|uniref:hypothetical protein n=1 Tax=Tolypothrix bouteillei TaxID=1246981 RepID=UPI0038B4E729